MKKTSLMIAALLLAAGHAPTQAQTAPVNEGGSRVRITAPALGLYAETGTIRQADEDAFLVRLDGSQQMRRIERNRITQMEAFAGRHRKALKGAAVGALVGGGTGVLMGLGSGDDPSSRAIHLDGETKAIFLGILLGSTGAVIGMIAGALTQRDEWTPVSPTVAPPMDVTVLPFRADGGTGLRLGVSLSVR